MGGGGGGGGVGLVGGVGRVGATVILGVSKVGNGFGHLERFESRQR